MTKAHSQQRGDLQALATTCLHTIYTPALHEVEPESELSAEDRIGVNISGEITFAAPAIVASTDVQCRSCNNTSQNPPIQSTRTEVFFGVVAMMKKCTAEVDEDSTEEQRKEKLAASVRGAHGRVIEEWSRHDQDDHVTR